MMKFWILVACFLPMVVCQEASASQDAPYGFTFLGFRLKSEGPFTMELACIALALVILLNNFRGRQKNESLAVQYTAALLRSDGPAFRNFAECKQELHKEGPDLYKLFVSGRRYCQGMAMTLRLTRRQDLLALAISSAARDILEIEVAMNEAFPQTVLFIGTPAAAKVIVAENPDISKLARRMEPTRDRLAAWPPKGLLVHAEHAGVFYEVASPAAMELIFGPAAFAEYGKYFRYLHASSDYAHAGHRQMLRLSFALPPTDDLEAMDRIINFAMLLVDALGSVKLNPDQVKRAADARRKVEEVLRPDAGDEKQRRLEERRAAKEAEERARLAKLPPDQRAKEVARKERIWKDRRMRSAVKKL